MLKLNSNMSLHSGISALQARIVNDLVAAHDYYSETIFAWELVRKQSEDGKSLTSINDVTKTETRAADFIGKANRYVNKEIVEATFLQFIVIFESFYFDFVGLWLLAYPQNLGAMTVDLKTILELKDSETVIRHVVNKKVSAILYDRPASWFAYLEDLAKLGCPCEDEIGRIAEAKASRDVLIHNRGIVNPIYIAKSGSFARFKEGERVAISPQYHSEIWKLIRKLVEDTSTAALTKTPCVTPAQN